MKGIIFTENLIMKIISNNSELDLLVSEWKSLGYKVGFVPTMGALHQGHMSLVRLSRADNQKTIVSIFVNPTQFNDTKDLEKYPRTPEADMSMLENESVDLVFFPEVETIYPDKNLHKFNLDGLDLPMEGTFRPGHFDGVADVVYRLFSMVKPDRAYFGEKDYQQLKIIQQMTKDANLPVEIHSGDIIREADGLAMSSRNVRLSEDERIHANQIFTILKAFDSDKFQNSPKQGESDLEEKLNAVKHLKTEYVSLVEDETMKEPDSLLNDVFYRICVAVWCGDVRLIDNLRFVISNNY